MTSGAVQKKKKWKNLFFFRTASQTTTTKRHGKITTKCAFFSGERVKCNQRLRASSWPFKSAPRTENKRLWLHSVSAERAREREMREKVSGLLTRGASTYRVAIIFNRWGRGVYVFGITCSTRLPVCLAVDFFCCRVANPPKLIVVSLQVLSADLLRARVTQRDTLTRRTLKWWWNTTWIVRFVFCLFFFFVYFVF